MTRPPVILLGLIVTCKGIALRAEPASECIDAVPGDSCHKFVTWALEKGLEKHPDWFPSFERSDLEENNFKQIQDILHSRNKAGCGKPCFAGPKTASPPDAEVQKAPVPEVQEATRAEAAAAAVEEAKPEATPAAPTEEASPALAETRPQEQPEVLASAAEGRSAPASDCIDAVPGDSCHKFVTWALAKGLEKHPDWFTSFERSDSDEQNFKQIQEIFHTRGKGGCGKPCFTATSSPSAEVLGPPATEVQKTPDADSQGTPAEAPAAAVEVAKPVAAPATPTEEARPAEASAPAAQEAAPAEPAAEEAKPEATPAELSVEAKPADALAPAAQEAAPAAPPAEEAKSEAAPAAQEEPPRSNLIGNLEAEVRALEAMRASPSLKTLRAEKRQLIHNLQMADKLEEERTARHSQHLQVLQRLEKDLKDLEGMENTPASSILRAEKRAQIEKAKKTDNEDGEQTTRELQRLHDPEASAKEVAPAAPADVKPPIAQERPQAADERPPRSDLIHKLEAELNAMDQLHISPALETLREEKRQFINNLQTADKLEAELKARQLENLQTATKLQSDLKALEAMDETQALAALREEKLTLLHNLQAADKSDTEQSTQELQRLSDPATAAKVAEPAEPAAIVDPEPAAAGHKPWWQEARAMAQRTWREVKAKAMVGKDEQQPEAPAAATEEAKPEAAPEVQVTTGDEAPAAPAEEVTPAASPAPADTERVEPSLGGCQDAVPGDRCHEFVKWALAKGVEQHPGWFPSFQRSDSDEQNFKQIQNILHSKGKAECGKPCSADRAAAPTPEA